MTVQLIDIFYQNVFKRFSSKYNIYRDLYEKDLLALEIRNVDYKLSQKIKRIILSNKEICYTTGKRGDKFSDLLSLGSYTVFKELAKEIIAIGDEDCGQKVSRTVKNVTEYDSKVVNLNGKNFNLDKAYVVGILNVTPDSFSDGGNYFDTKDAVAHGLELLKNGANILDIGGESTRPGAEPVSVDEELKRVLPVVEEILRSKPEALISVDTMKSDVAAKALKAGAKIVNDISSFENDFKMPDVVKEYNAAVILMHMKGNPQTMQDNPFYDDVVSEVYDFIKTKVDVAKKHGIKDIIVDPGIGFGKRVGDNYEIIKRLNEFKGIGMPLMIGLARKSFIGKAFNLGINERDNPTLAAETLAVKNGARFIRTHNVKQAIFASKVNSFIDNPEQLSDV